MTWLTVMEYLWHKWQRYVPLVVNTSRPFPHSWFITGFVSRLTRRVPLVEQELLLSGAHEFSIGFQWGSLCVCLVDRYLSLCTFSFGHCVLFFFDLRILITPLVSSSFSHYFANSLYTTQISVDKTAVCTLLLTVVKYFPQ
jgi:hypothetical protein